MKEKTMSIDELLEFPVEYISNDISSLFGLDFTHVPETGFEDQCDLESKGCSDKLDYCENVQIHYLKNEEPEVSEIWQMALVTVKGQPAMFIQNAGKHGMGHHERFIVNKENFIELIKQLCYHLYPINDDDSIKLHEGEIPVSFYGMHL